MSVLVNGLLYGWILLDPQQSTTTYGWTTFPTSYCSTVIQDGVQDGRRIFKSPCHQLLFYSHV